MGSPITLSGFNNIDFSQVLNALMAQERLPVTQLTTQQTALTNQKGFFATFASKLASLESAVDALTSIAGDPEEARRRARQAALDANQYSFAGHMANFARAMPAPLGE